MSYDLFLSPRSGEIGTTRFANHFGGRPHYTVAGAQAVYRNEDTGVYFVFEYAARDADAANDGPHHPVSLNVNYFRPSFFIREAETEVTAFVQAFDCVAFDPQINGMGEGEYDAEKLIDGWDYGNALGYQAFLGGNPDRAVHTLPVAALMRQWAWNRDRRWLQERLGESHFVPKMMTLVADGQLMTAATWPDAAPIAVPPVDHFLVMRDELAPSRWFRKDRRPVLIERRAVEALFAKHRDVRPDGLHVLGYDDAEPPDDVVQFVLDLSATDIEMNGVAPDQVLDRELVEKFRPA
jgi:hypothetical protein